MPPKGVRCAAHCKATTGSSVDEPTQGCPGSIPVLRARAPRHTAAADTRTPDPQVARSGGTVRLARRRRDDRATCRCRKTEPGCEAQVTRFGWGWTTERWPCRAPAPTSAGQDDPEVADVRAAPVPAGRPDGRGDGCRSGSSRPRAETPGALRVDEASGRAVLLKTKRAAAAQRSFVRVQPTVERYSPGMSAAAG